MRYVLGLALLVSAAAHSAPLANLVLSCPDESAIGQAVDACQGYIYETPTNERIVVSSSYSWRKAADLAASDLLQVCTIAVEPGAYSSCRDSASIRRTAFVPKDSVIMGGRNSVIVSKTGGDYTDPVTAAENAFAGDSWCVAPQWPLQPCVMAIGEGIFILSKTLSIAEGLAVSGNGKGDTMLVTENGVETAVSSFGNIRISDLTIINSQLGLARTNGVKIAKSNSFGGVLVQLHDVAIHVSGAAENVAVVRGDSLEILDSEITAAGNNTTGISNLNLGPPDQGPHATLERSQVSAETAIYEEDGGHGATVRLVDSRISGRIFFNYERSLLEIIRTQLIGNVSASNDQARVVITDSSIKGNVGVRSVGGHSLSITNSSVDGSIAFGFGAAPAIFDGLTLHGQLLLDLVQATIVRSYISSASTAAALSLDGARIQLEQTFVQGAQALAAGISLSGRSESRVDASSSVLAGAVSGSAGSVFSCTDTYGADYELLNASCQPQGP
jgi:hypothetical protein